MKSKVRILIFLSMFFSLSVQISMAESTTECAAQITNHEAKPAGFNSYEEESTLIRFSINCNVLIELNILDSSNNQVLSIVDNIEKSPNDYEYSWNGTFNNLRGGAYVSTGQYQYEIIAKDIESGEVIDVVKNIINLIVIEEETKEEVKEANRDAASMALQNTSEGSTAETGPEVLIYTMLPASGVLYHRKRRAKN